MTMLKIQNLGISFGGLDGGIAVAVDHIEQCRGAVALGR